MTDTEKRCYNLRSRKVAPKYKPSKAPYLKEPTKKRLKTQQLFTSPYFLRSKRKVLELKWIWMNSGNNIIAEEVLKKLDYQDAINLRLVSKSCKQFVDGSRNLQIILIRHLRKNPCYAIPHSNEMFSFIEKRLRVSPGDLFYQSGRDIFTNSKSFIT